MLYLCYTDEFTNDLTLYLCYTNEFTDASVIYLCYIEGNIDLRRNTLGSSKWNITWIFISKVVCWSWSDVLNEFYYRCTHLENIKFDLMIPQAGICLRGHRILIEIEVKSGRTLIEIRYIQAHSSIENEGVQKLLKTFKVIISNLIICEPLCKLWSANETLAQ